MSQSKSLYWLNTSNTNEIELYELWDAEKKLLTLLFNNFSHTAKVECLSSRRMFKIEKDGLLKTKTIFKNEYGVKIGQFAQEHWYNHEGLIELNEEKFHYTTHNNPLAELIIYKDNPKQPLLVCGLQLNNGETSVHFQKHHQSDKYSIFLMSLAWFLFLPVAKEYVSNVSIV
ncbi:MAG: hypothetical protein MUE72_12210 [Chitinophagaceae bacterium]|jgi:hypothetical protein|nr:hypothetical protein [Chitinophagaceae bacterium]